MVIVLILKTRLKALMLISTTVSLLMNVILSSKRIALSVSDLHSTQDANELANFVGQSSPVTSESKYYLIDKHF